jgi:hypothetical protein
MKKFNLGAINLQTIVVVLVLLAAVSYALKNSQINLSRMQAKILGPSCQSTCIDEITNCSEAALVEVSGTCKTGICCGLTDQPDEIATSGGFAGLVSNLTKPNAEKVIETQVGLDEELSPTTQEPTTQAPTIKTSPSPTPIPVEKTSLCPSGIRYCDGSKIFVCDDQTGATQEVWVCDTGCNPDNAWCN